MVLCDCSGVQAEVTVGSGMNNMGQIAEDVTAPVKEAASEAVKAAGDYPVLLTYVAPAECLTDFTPAWICLAE